MVNVDMDNYFEFDSISTHVFNYGITGELWKETFDELYPNHVLIKTLESSVNAIKTIESKGYKPFQIDHEGIYTFLLNRGIRTAQSVFGEGFKYEYSMDINGFSKLNQAIKIIETVVPTINFDFIVGVYTEEDEDIACNGLTLELPDEVDPEHMNKTILINREFAENETIVKIMSTLVHEWDHYSTGIGDGNMEGRMFREVADSRMGELILQIFKITNGSESIV
jgi:hypothetical protein